MDTLGQVFSRECYAIFIRTPILQSSNKRMRNLARHYSEEDVHRFSSKEAFTEFAFKVSHSQKATCVGVSF